MKARALALDCDGVILDSNTMKRQIFRELLDCYPDAATKPFLEFQRSAFGTSRFRLFDLFFEKYLCRPPMAGEVDGLLAAFGARCSELYPRQAFTPGAYDTISKLHSEGVALWVVSGSAEEELRNVLNKLHVARYFRGIYGSPATKSSNLARVKQNCKDKVVFVGDAEADYKASVDCDVPFVGMSTFSATPQTIIKLSKKHEFPLISKLADLL